MTPSYSTCILQTSKIKQYLYILECSLLALQVDDTIAISRGGKLSLKNVMPQPGTEPGTLAFWANALPPNGCFSVVLYKQHCLSKLQSRLSYTRI